MKMTRDIAVDLLPLYLAGEASDDTRALLEEFFQQDPEFAELVETDVDQFLNADIETTLTEDLEMKSLERTKKFLQIRGSLLGAAIFFTILPFSVYHDSRELHWIFEGHPTSVAVVWTCALVCWTGYFVCRHQVRASRL